MPKARILFVDDEPGVLLTLASVLEKNQFDVKTATNVPEGLAAINSQRFDILIADLNLGAPGDGFELVSAMRRTQPAAVNIILTGYPDFYAAVEGIRRQVDEIVVKPTDIEELVTLLRHKLEHHVPRQPVPVKRVPAVLRENKEKVLTDWLSMVAFHPELAGLPLSKEDRIDHLPELIEELIDRLESHPEKTSKAQMRAAARHGRTRRQQGYSIPLIVEETRLLERSIFAMLQGNLLSLDMSYLIPDLIRISDSVQGQLRESLTAFLQKARRKAA